MYNLLNWVVQGAFSCPDLDGVLWSFGGRWRDFGEV